jgi:hypothetical protein
MMLLQNLELPKGFKLQYVNKGKEVRGGYNYQTNTLSINKDIFDTISVDELATAINHELIHAFTGKAIKLYEAGNLSELTDTQVKAIKELERVQKLYINNIIATEGEAGVNAFIAKYNKWKKEGGQPTWSQEEISKYYGALKLSEFITMALTDSGFQNYLNNIPGENNRSLWEQIKDLLSSILNSMGLDINPNSMLATAIKDSMDVIEALQPGRIKPTQPTVSAEFSNIKDYINSIYPNWINNKENELLLASEFRSIQLLSREESDLKERISFGKEAESLLKEIKNGKNPFKEVSAESQIPNLLYAVISGKLAKDNISETDMFNNIFSTKTSTQKTENKLNLEIENNNKMNLEDWENYSNIQDLFDESITQSPINRDALEKYSLICGK